MELLHQLQFYFLSLHNYDTISLRYSSHAGLAIVRRDAARRGREPKRTSLVSTWKPACALRKRVKAKCFEDNAVEQQWNKTPLDGHWCCDKCKKVCEDRRVMYLHKGVLFSVEGIA